VRVLRSRRRSARAAQPGRGAPDARAALRAILDDWLDGHVRFEPLLAKGASNPRAAVPQAIERGRLGDLLAGPELAAIMTSDAPLSSGARRRSCWWRCRPAGDRGGAARAAATGPRDRRLGGGRRRPPGRRGGAPARAGDRRATRGGAGLRVRAALALAACGDTAACPCWATRSITATTCCSAGDHHQPRQAARSGGPCPC
jgi:hypothetical protein